jgi:hypothetical protein
MDEAARVLNSRRFVFRHHKARVSRNRFTRAFDDIEGVRCSIAAAAYALYEFMRFATAKDPATGFQDMWAGADHLYVGLAAAVVAAACIVWAFVRRPREIDETTSPGKGVSVGRHRPPRLKRRLLTPLSRATPAQGARFTTETTRTQIQHGVSAALSLR